MPSLGKPYSDIYNRLCHFVALQKSPDAVSNAQDGLVQTAAFILGADISHAVPELQGAVVDYFGLNFTRSEIEESLSRLEANGVMRPDASGFVLSGGAAERIKAATTSSKNLEARVKAEWLEELRGRKLTDGVDEDQLWNALHSYLSKMFARHGAQTRQFIAPDVANGTGWDQTAGIILDEVVEEHLPGLSKQVSRAAVRSFLQTSTPDRTKYLSELLDGTFSFYALTVDEVTSELLRRNLLRMKLMVDTNVIFGLLHLHANPFVAVSEELLSLIRDQKLPFDLYYHPLTIQEFREVLSFYRDRLTARKWTQSLSRGILKAGCLMSGIEMRYHELNAKTALDPNLFFERYNNVERLLQDLGITVYRNDYSQLLEDDQTLNLISKYKLFLAHEKPFNTIRHDVVLWRILQTIRQRSAEPFSAGAMMLSCDYQFFRFDQQKLKGKGEVGTVILPSIFLQLLRPFVCRTDDFDRRFVQTFSLPEFRTMYSADLRAVSRIAQTLALYSDIREDLATKILTDEALISRVREFRDDDPEVATIIESAIVADYQRVQAESEMLQARLKAEEQKSADAEQKFVIAASEAATAVQIAKEKETAFSVAQQAVKDSEKRAVEAKRQFEAKTSEAEDERRMKIVEQQGRQLAEQRAASLEEQLRVRARKERRLLLGLFYLFPSAVLFLLRVFQFRYFQGKEWRGAEIALFAGGMLGAFLEQFDWFSGHPKRLGLRLSLVVLATGVASWFVNSSWLSGGIAVFALAVLLLIAQLIDR